MGTQLVPDGTYNFKLEEGIKLCNKDPNLSPVISDPEVIGDSVDWVKCGGETNLVK